MTAKPFFYSFVFLALQIAPSFAAGPLDGLDAGLSRAAAALPPPSAPAGVADKVPLPEWTVMVFVNAKNDLANFGLSDVNEMEMAGSTAKVNVVAELGLLNKGVKRYFVTKDKRELDITSPVVQDLGSPDMGDWKHLAEFANWARANYPAKRYMLVIWNHGSGWVTTKGISYDDETKNHISTPELGLAMKAIGKVDILAMDACLMQMAEVDYEIKDFADVILASEETAPGNGFPYDLVLKGMNSAALKPAETVAAGIVESYTGYYARKNIKATLSAVRTAALPKLAALLDEWAAAALAYPGQDKLRAAANGAACYYVDEYKDLADLMAKISAATADPLLAEKGAAVINHIRTALVASNAATPAMGSGSNGVSIYVSRDGASPRYKALAFSSVTRWDEFLAALPRYYPPPPPPHNDPLNPDEWWNRQ